jgi:hypothetical protein
MKMKIKQNVYIARKDDFLRDPQTGYGITSGRHMDNTWTFLTEIEFDVEVDTAPIIEQVSDEIDEAILELEGRVEHLKTKKAELLALPSL